MGSRRADGPNSRSHARPKGGKRARNVVLALGVITVTAGVGVTLATGGGNDGKAAGQVETNAAGDVAGQGEDNAAAGSASPIASPSGSPKTVASTSPSASLPASAKPKRTASPKTAPKPTVQARSGSGTGGSGGAGGSASSSGGSGSGAGSGSSNGAEAQVLTLVNKERASASCSPLTSNAKLTEAADDYSDVMARSGVMSHTGPDGSTMSGRVDAAGYLWSTLGENIARGQSDAAAVMDAWMNSPGHRANILNCSFKEIGIGVHFGDGGPWWTQNFGASR
ncbi:CAP domain-containing protein [Streptomyces lunaelactis]|uniref:CAP domain-containing protein n=1 Tax=Streptomyces lunaelactis TaxID=1535768 RepID=UPI0015847FDA|nr:CAP domain-containing protein [Streptomyces lunaelactis]NUL05708.1 CAP domain-containing protein [Streptomyces lunaelactis]